MQAFTAYFANTSPAVWRVSSALCFGVADFLARFSSRQLGHQLALFATLLVGAVFFSIVFFTADVRLVWSDKGALMIVLHGVEAVINSV